MKKHRVLWLGLIMVAAIGLMAADLTTYQLNREIAHGSTRYVTTDGSIALRVKWVGTAGSGASIDVNAAGDLLFTTDGTTADATVSTDGTIDVSGATENTFGEVADAINLSANWEATLVDVLPSTSSNNVLTDVAENATGVIDEEGLALTYNTADLDMASVSIGPEYTIDDDLSVSGDSLLNRRTTPTSGFSPVYTNELVYVCAGAVFDQEEIAGATARVSIWAVNGNGSGATETLLWREEGGTSITLKTIDTTAIYDHSDGRHYPIRAPRGQRLVLIYDDVVAMTSANIQVHGLSVPNN